MLESKKMHLMVVRQGKILGHIVSKNGISTDEEKMQAIDMPNPRNVKEIQVFMGHCGYYLQFIFQYPSISPPVYALIVAYDWIEECKSSF